MTLSEPFIRRPVGTTLLALGLVLLGLVAYTRLPVAALPSVDLPTLMVTASRPGADPETMAASVAAPLERRLGAIAGVNEITSVSSLGATRIILQFDLARSVDGAASDVQAALNAAATDLPGDLPTLPSFRKLNPAAAPVLTLALTSDTLTASALYDAADTVLVQRLSQVPGVGEVSASGADQPAVRVRLDPARLAAMGLSTEAVRQAIVAATALGPAGSLDGPDRVLSLGLNAQLRSPEQYGRIILRAGNGVAVRLADVATVDEGVRNARSDAFYDGRPAVLLDIAKQADANVLATIDAVKALLPELRDRIPAGIDIRVLTDRTVTIRANVEHMQETLVATAVLVMVVVLVFLRRLVPTLAAGVAVPLSLAGTFGAMWASGFSLDDLSLMALAVSVGFVVDDAIVVVETVQARIEAGEGRLQAALEGTRQVGFTIVSISASLLAAFIPLFAMPGIVGRFFQEFSATLAFAIAISTVVALTVTPMMMGRLSRHREARRPGRLDRLVEGAMEWLTAVYLASLAVAIRWWGVTLLVLAGAVGLTVWLYVTVPKGFVPEDDPGSIQGFTQAATTISYPAMVALQARAAAIVRGDPAVSGVGSNVGGGQSVNQGRLTIALVDPDRREPTPVVIDRLRRALQRLPGLDVFLSMPQDLRAGGRQTNSTYQFTLWDADYAELVAWAPKVVDRLKAVPGLADVTTDRQPNGLQATIAVDRTRAAQLGVNVAAVDALLNNIFAQRQVATVYDERNQYRVVVEGPDIDDPGAILALHVPGTGGAMVPLGAIATIRRGVAPLVVNHQGQYPSITISYNLGLGTTMQAAQAAVTEAAAAMHLPEGLHAEFAGDARNFGQSAGSQPLLILAALAAVYIVLGVLYESLIHPLTILSTLPSAGLGALLALMVMGTELTLIAFIGIILLIGLVKKNGIMLVDVALDAERRRGLTSRQAITEAATRRFRPILMTTLAALLGAVPLVIGTGPGAELRRPLGITVIGGLMVSQLLTLYTTPVVYLVMARLAQLRAARSAPVPAE